MLQNIMHRISPSHEIRPCEVFDLIGGSSTGGIIAIMLGRLVRVTIPHAMSCFQLFCLPWLTLMTVMLANESI